VPLRSAELCSLIRTLTAAQGGSNEGLHPLWSELCGFARSAVTARDSRPFW
jgi:hypothetical protein